MDRAAEAVPAAPRKRGGPPFLNYILILAFSVGGILSGAIALVFWQLRALGGA